MHSTDIPKKPNNIQLEDREISNRIHTIRGQRVMMDSDIADLYGIKVKALSQAVRRNLDRFPADFMFQLTREEDAVLRSQNVTSSWGGRRYLPLVFTEQGVAMLSSVLRSSRAVMVNIAIMRAFMRIREMMSMHRELSEKLKTLEKKIAKHDAAIMAIFDAIRQITEPTKEPKHRIGFR